MNDEFCSCNVIHREILAKVAPFMPDENMFENLAQFFKMFADKTRLKILKALSLSEMCVCDISALLNMNQSAVSHQLRLLKQLRLVKTRKAGKVVYYSLNDSHVETILQMGIQHILEQD